MQIEFATINWPIWLLIIVMVIVFFVGAFFGFYNSSTEARKKTQLADLKAENAIRDAKALSERVALLQKQAAEKPAQQFATAGTTLLRLWQDAERGAKLEMDGGAVDTLNISEPTRKRLIALISVMRPWVEGKASVGASPLQVPPAAPVVFAPPVVAEVRPVSMMSALTNAAGLNKKDKPAASLSMVQQIDQVLQTRLASGPLAGRGIRLSESPDGGVTVMVGVQKFAGISDVTDPEIQSAIRAAIAEWEKKYAPG